MTTIIAFGDSITQGYWDDWGGWAQRFRSAVDMRNLDDEEFYCEVHNCGVSGDTVEDVLDRFGPEFRAREDSEEETYVVLAVGANDAQYDNEDEGMRTPPDRFRERYAELLDRSRELADHVVVLGLTPVDQSRVDPIPWKQRFSYREDDRERYDAIIGELCEDRGITYLDLAAELPEDFHEYLEDGVHPDTKGHRLLAERIQPFLERSFGIEL